MTAKIIDGQALAKSYRNSLRADIAQIIASGQRPPCLAVVLVGDDPASHVYVGGKEKACLDVGIISRRVQKSAQATQSQLREALLELAEDRSVDGILLQLPLPKHLDSGPLIECIPGSKDVDGLTIESQGRLVKGVPGFLPCTPAGIMEILRTENIPLTGTLAAVVGRSVLVGSSVTRLLEQAKATTISIASSTVDAPKLASQADLLIVAAGVCNLVGPSWIKPGATVIDLGKPASS